MIENANLLLFLLLAVVIARASMLLKRIGQPSLLGELMGGILITLLGFLNIKFFQGLPTNSTVSFFSELGGIFLLFEIGLESDLSLLRENKIYPIVLAFFGTAIPFVAGYAFVYYFNSRINTSLCLFVAATLSATSTGISVRIFKEYKLTNSKACQIVLASSIIDDIISLIILTCITAIVTNGGFSINNLMIILFKIIMFFALLYLLIKALITRFYDKFNKKDDSWDLAIIISACLFASLFAHNVGLSSIIGAFLAGALLDKNHFKDKHYLVYPFIWIFVPIFFIYSGMQIDIKSLYDLSVLKMALILSIVAILTKVLPPLLIPNKMPFLDKLSVGLGMVPRGEIGLIIALVGKENGILNNYYFNIIALMVILTSLIAPILLNQVILAKNRIL